MQSQTLAVHERSLRAVAALKDEGWLSPLEVAEVAGFDGADGLVEVIFSLHVLKARGEVWQSDEARVGRWREAETVEDEIDRLVAAPFPDTIED